MNQGKKQWRDWDGNLKSVAALYNQMTPMGKRRLHTYLREHTAPSSLVKTKLIQTNQQENS